MTDLGRLAARPRAAAQPGPTGEYGERRLELETRRDSLIYVPPAATDRRAVPLALLLHGAGGEARHGLELLKPWADPAGIILLAPASRGKTWDFILGRYGPDVEMIDRGLQRVFEGYRIDPTRIAIGGFSDGASYALSLGLTNGDLFTHVLAFSPGFTALHGLSGKPRIFVAHGINDSVLPINRCSRAIVPRLRKSGYTVEYREFDGGHAVPPEIARAGLKWLRLTAGQRKPLEI